MISKVILFLTATFVARAALGYDHAWLVTCRVNESSALQFVKIKFTPSFANPDVRSTFNKKKESTFGRTFELGISGKNKQDSDNASLGQYAVKSNLPYRLEVVENHNNECLNNTFTLKGEKVKGNDVGTLVVDMHLNKGHLNHGQNRGCWFDRNNSYDATIRIDTESERSEVKARCATEEAGAGRKAVMRRGRARD